MPNFLKTIVQMGLLVAALATGERAWWGLFVLTVLLWTRAKFNAPKGEDKAERQ